MMYCRDYSSLRRLLEFGETTRVERDYKDLQRLLEFADTDKVKRDYYSSKSLQFAQTTIVSETLLQFRESAVVQTVCYSSTYYWGIFIVFLRILLDLYTKTY